MSEKLPSTLPAFMWHFIKMQQWRFAILFLSTVSVIFENNLLPYALKLMVNIVMFAGANRLNAFALLAFPCGLFLGSWMCMVFIWRIQEWVGTYTFPQFRTDMRMALFQHTESHSHAYFADNFAGSIATKIGDLPRSTSAILDFLRWRLCCAFWATSATIISIGFINPVFSLVLASWVVVHMSLSYFCGRKVNVLATEFAVNSTTLTGQIVDSITNITAVRLFSRRQHEYDYIGKWQAIVQESNRQVSIAMFKARISLDIPVFFLYATTLYVLVNGWKNGWASPGDIVFVVFTVFNVIRQVWQLGIEIPNLFNEVGICKQALTLITKEHGLVNAPNAVPLNVNKGEIEFRNVHFNYIRGIDIFRDKQIIIPGGQKIGLVGFSGSGKSTFVNLILRLYDLEAGQILIDGQDIAAATQETLRAAIAMIPQDSTLFHRTLMENIRYGRIDASDEEVLEASKLAHCHEFISQLKEGYNSMVGERGIKLSGGQRQRINIARAVLKNAPILILDEATSSLDSVTEKYIQESLNMLMKNRTTIVIAHRLSTLAHMDRILIFKGGTIIEDGTHQELMAAGGHYSMLWNMQAGGFLPAEN